MRRCKYTGVRTGHMLSGSLPGFAELDEYDEMPCVTLFYALSGRSIA